MTRTLTIEPTETAAYIATQALFDARQERETFKPMELGAVHKTLTTVYDELDPQDVDRPLNQGLFRYENGKAAFAFRTADGGFDTPIGFTRTGLGQLGRRVLGAGGLKHVERQRDTGETGRKLAEVNWAFGLQGQHEPTLLRTVKLPGQAFRTARAALSGGGRGYAKIDNIDITRMLLDAPEFRELPVIEARVGLDSMRLRLLLNPEDGDLFDPETGRLRNPTNAHFCGLELPVPMVEIINGEIGNSSFRVSYGTYFYRCLNGLGAWGGDGANYRWNHTGGDDRADKIKAAFGDAVRSARVHATNQVQDYKTATEIAVDDFTVILDAWGGDLTGRQTQRVIEAATDETSWPGRKLASIVDGITLAAQAETDLAGQMQMERFAARLLRRGLGQAKDGRLVVAQA